MNGPIPTHPYYDKSNPNTFVDKPVPRVRPEAKQIATKAMGTVGMLLVEGNRCGSAPMRYSKIYLFFFILFFMFCFLTHLWGAYAIPVALSGIRRTSCVVCVHHNYQK